MSAIQVRIGNKFRLGPRIARGSFAEIYSGKNVQNDYECVIKMEESNTHYPTLENQSLVLQKLQGGIGIPGLHYFQKSVDFNFLVIDKLGNSLEDYFNDCGRKFSLKTVLMIADQVLSTMEFVHSKNILYRDVSSHNFLMGLGKKNHMVFTCDFGLACSKEEKQEVQPVGTVLFMGPEVLQQGKHSFKSDLQALGLMLVYFLKQGLPWQHVKSEQPEERFRLVSGCKRAVNLEQLCEGLPRQFSKYFKMLKSMPADVKPDYYALKRLFRERMVLDELDYDYIFDWFLIPISFKDIRPGSNFPAKTCYVQKEPNPNFCNHYAVQPLTSELKKKATVQRSRSVHQPQKLKQKGPSNRTSTVEPRQPKQTKPSQQKKKHCVVY